MMVIINFVNNMGHCGGESKIRKEQQETQMDYEICKEVLWKEA